MTSILFSSAGASGGSYHADAVHFDGNVALETDNLTAADSSFVSGSAWFRVDTSASNYVALPEYDNANTGSGCQTSGIAGDNSVRFYWSDQSFINQILLTSDASSVLPNNAWHHILYSFDLSLGAGSRVWAVYIDDVLTPLSIVSDDGGAAILLSFSGKDIYVANSGGSQISDVADEWFAPGVNLLVAGAIPTVTRRKFISATGKPVDPAGFPTSAILFSGNATLFPVNHGSGGAFDLTGVPTDAGTSPSD